MTANAKRYATIDLNSGYVWWVGDAESPEQACELSDMEGLDEPRQFVEVNRSQIDRATYAVYAVPADFTVTDGEGPEQISAVQAWPLVGLFAAAGGAA